MTLKYNGLVEENPYPKNQFDHLLYKDFVVEFEKDSTINFYNENDDLLFVLQPEVIKTIYATHRLLELENIENERTKTPYLK